MSERLELDPDPTPAEREAVATALNEERLLTETAREPESAWRQAGLREAVERTPQALSPRSSRGATRA